MKIEEMEPKTWKEFDELVLILQKKLEEEERDIHILEDNLQKKIAEWLSWRIKTRNRLRNEVGSRSSLNNSEHEKKQEDK